MQFSSSQPIGIFDSGIGGLTVAKAVIDALPLENIIYFGDTARLPYGDKSKATIKNYAREITEILLAKGCKLILIACGSASAAAFEELKAEFSTRVTIFDVINPVVEFLEKNYRGRQVGLIGTKLTVNSNIFGQKINKLGAKITLHSQAAPLIVPVIEEGLHNHDKIVDALLEIYLSNPNFKSIEALVLACTHYPLLKEKISAFFDDRIEIIDASKIVAEKVKKQLETQGLLHTGKKTQQHFYISDYTPAFADNARRFFGEDVVLEHYKF